MSSLSGSPAVRTSRQPIRFSSICVSGAIFFAPAAGSADPSGGGVLVEVIQFGDAPLDRPRGEPECFGDQGDAAVPAGGGFDRREASAVLLAQGVEERPHAVTVQVGQFRSGQGHPWLGKWSGANPPKPSRLPNSATLIDQAVLNEFDVIDPRQASSYSLLPLTEMEWQRWRLNDLVYVSLLERHGAMTTGPFTGAAEFGTIVIQSLAASF